MSEEEGEEGSHEALDEIGGKPFSTLTREKSKVVKRYLHGYYETMTNDGPKFVESHVKSKEKKMILGDYDILKVIGRGAFGVIRLCRGRNDPTGSVMAMKSLSKEHLVRRRQVDHVHSEREILVKARARQPSPWVVQLYYTFQDETYLHFVMEFLQGGDLMTWLIRYDVFPEKMAQVYIAEIILAVHEIHKMGFAHRDVKPDNILLDRDGHVKITDFGLCKEVGIVQESTADSVAHNPSREQWHALRSRELMQSAVGSPGYMAPEVIQGKGYGMECDWWSVGVILYEMLCGYPPFYGDDGMQTRHKIVRWKEFLEFPTDQAAPPISSSARDLICSLLRDASTRLKFEDIISHRFFRGIEWVSLRTTTMPIRPVLRDSLDTTYFDTFTDDVVPGMEDQGADRQTKTGGPTGAPSRDTQMLFYGFTAKFPNK